MHENANPCRGVLVRMPSAFLAMACHRGRAKQAGILHRGWPACPNTCYCIGHPRHKGGCERRARPFHFIAQHALLADEQLAHIALRDICRSRGASPVSCGRRCAVCACVRLRIHRVARGQLRDPRPVACMAWGRESLCAPHGNDDTWRRCNVIGWRARGGPWRGRWPSVGAGRQVSWRSQACQRPLFGEDFSERGGQELGCADAHAAERLHADALWHPQARLTWPSLRRRRTTRPRGSPTESMRS